MISGRRTSAVSAVFSATAEIITGPLPPNTAIVVMPVSAAKRPRAVPSDAACSAVAPGLSLAIALNIDKELPIGADTRNGTQARVRRSGYACVSGKTPTIVCDSPSSCTTRPSTLVSAPKRSRQRPSDRTTGRRFPSRSSRSSNSDPMRGRAPSTVNKLAEQAARRIRSGSPAPDSVAVRWDQAAMLSIVVAPSRHAT